MKKIENSYLKWTNIGLIVSGVSLVLAIGGFLNPIFFIFGAIGLVAGISIFLKSRGLAQKVDKVLAGDFYVHWKYEPDEWRRFIEAEFLRQAADIQNTSRES